MTLPIRRYEGPVHLLENAADLEVAGSDIGQELVVGFDTETRPSFQKGQSYRPSLVQIATARAVYLLPLARLDCAGFLGGILANPAIIKAGVALADDLRKLREVFPFQETRVIDLGVIARRCGIEQTGVRNLTGLFLGFRLPKGTRTSNWARVQLSPAQITYAASDAWVCRELHVRFGQLGLLGTEPPGAGGTRDYNRPSA
jgi:ribonuclease D